MSTPSASEALAWEETYRKRSAIATIIGGNLVLIAGVAFALVVSGVPQVGVLDALRAAAGEKLSTGSPGLLTPVLQFYDDRAIGVLLSYIGQAAGAALAAAALGYLFTATKSRRPELPRAALYAAVVGPVLAGVALLAQGIASMVKVHQFVSGSDHSTAAAHEVLKGGVVLATQVLHQTAGLAIAFAFVLVSLNAMRVGLLTRFMGVLGIIAGALFVFPLGSSFVVQGFWMIAFGFMLLGRWPGGRPPAWETGRAEPWPTQQELREARSAAAGDGPVPAAQEAADEAVADDDDSPVPHPSSKKRKRKRR